MTPEERFKAYLDFWGYGDPSEAKVVMIGLEDGGGWDDILGGERLRDELVNHFDAEARKRVASPFMPRSEWHNEAAGRTELMQCYIASRLRHRVDLGDNQEIRWDEISPSEYFEKYFGQREFLANLYPLAFSGEDSFDHRLRDYIAVPGTTKSEYYKAVVDQRIDVLRGLLEEVSVRCEPTVLLMHAGQMWDRACVRRKIEAKLFPRAQFEQDGAFRWSRDRRVWFTRHPRAMSYAYADELVRRICARSDGRPTS